MEFKSINDAREAVRKTRNKSLDDVVVFIMQELDTPTKLKEDKKKLEEALEVLKKTNTDKDNLSIKVAKVMEILGDEDDLGEIKQTIVNVAKEMGVDDPTKSKKKTKEIKEKEEEEIAYIYLYAFVKDTLTANIESIEDQLGGAESEEEHNLEENIKKDLEELKTSLESFGVSLLEALLSLKEEKSELEEKKEGSSLGVDKKKVEKEVEKKIKEIIKETTKKIKKSVKGTTGNLLDNTESTKEVTTGKEDLKEAVSKVVTADIATSEGKRELEKMTKEERKIRKEIDQCRDSIIQIVQIIETVDGVTEKVAPILDDDDNFFTEMEVDGEKGEKGKKKAQGRVIAEYLYDLNAYSATKPKNYEKAIEALEAIKGEKDKDKEASKKTEKLKKKKKK